MYRFEGRIVAVAEVALFHFVVEIISFLSPLPSYSESEALRCRFCSRNLQIKGEDGNDKLEVVLRQPGMNASSVMEQAKDAFYALTACFCATGESLRYEIGSVR